MHTEIVNTHNHNHLQMSSSSSEPTRKEFLWDFEEASAEKPADGLNGECIIHYKDEYSIPVILMTNMRTVR